MTQLLNEATRKCNRAEQVQLYQFAGKGPGLPPTRVAHEHGKSLTEPRLVQGWDNVLDYSAVVAPCVNFRPAACWDLLHFALLCNMPDT